MPRKKKVEIPEEFLNYPSYVKNTLYPLVNSKDVRERFSSLEEKLSDLDLESPSNVQNGFLKSLYEFYYNLKKEIIQTLENREPKIRQASVKLDTVSLLRIKTRLKYVNNFYDKMEDNPELSSYNIWSHVCILAEGELKIAIGEDSYIANLSEKSKKEKSKSK